MIHLVNLNQAQVDWHIQPSNRFFEEASVSDENIFDSVLGFSAYLFKHVDSKQYPEIVSLAFWFRHAHLKQVLGESKSNISQKSVNRVFHIAPANVDTVFMYSLLLSVLCGNKNIVRISQRSGDVTKLLVAYLREYMKSPKGAVLVSLISVIEYDAQHQHITEQLSQWCDLRVIWGGDKAIASISDIAPQTPQICFPDRYSVAVLQLDDTSNVTSIANAFLADILPFTQQACSSPKALYWLNTSRIHQEKFWQQVNLSLVSLTHQFEMSHKVEQHILLQRLIGNFGMTVIEDSGKKIADFAKLVNIGAIARCKVKTLTSSALAAHTGFGLIIENDILSVDEIACSSKLQTIAYRTLSEWQNPKGQFKRIVPIGKALEFSPVWDGVDLLQSFS